MDKSQVNLTADHIEGWREKFQQAFGPWGVPAYEEICDLALKGLALSSNERVSAAACKVCGKTPPFPGGTRCQRTDCGLIEWAHPEGTRVEVDVAAQLGGMQAMLKAYRSNDASSMEVCQYALTVNWQDIIDKAAARSAIGNQLSPFQGRVAPFMEHCFGPEISADTVERYHRFIEESLELAQALGCTAQDVHMLVDYVFGRPVGVPHQEVGGVMVTLAALCLAAKLDMHAAGEDELRRVWGMIDRIREKQRAKPKGSPLPQAAAPFLRRA